LQVAENRVLAAESAVPVGYRMDLVPHRRPSSALVVWRPRGQQ
jgi:MerR family transcriptional regulator/heat shock protein HspR